MRLFAFALLLSSGILAACEKKSEEPASSLQSNHFRVMSYNLGGLAELDRDGDGLAEEPKPAEEVDALLLNILEAQPDVLCLQEIGTREDLEGLHRQLLDRGLDVPFAEYLYTPGSPLNLAMLSRFPLIDVVLHTNDVYRMGDAEVPVTHGYLQATVSVRPDRPLTIFNADLKSRDYHSLGQTEMRRNEARLLNNHLRSVLRKFSRPDVVVAGTFHDSIRSAALRAVTGQKQEHLQDARIADSRGDIWTVYDADSEVYRREDYVLVSPSLASKLVMDQSFILSSDKARQASSHRPVTAAFLVQDADPPDTKPEIP